MTPVSNAAGAFSVPEANVNGELPGGDQRRGDVGARRPPLAPAPADRRQPATASACTSAVRRWTASGRSTRRRFRAATGRRTTSRSGRRAAGFVNLIDDATFVYHKRSASFGTHKTELIAAAKARLQAKHPQYPPAVKQFLAEDPLRELRSALRGALRRGPAEVKRLPRSRPTVLLVLHSGGGGTPETNRDMARSLAASFRCLTLSCDVDHWVLRQVEADAGGRAGTVRLPQPAGRFASHWTRSAPRPSAG